MTFFIQNKESALGVKSKEFTVHRVSDEVQVGVADSFDAAIALRRKLETPEPIDCPVCLDPPQYGESGKYDVAYCREGCHGVISGQGLTRGEAIESWNRNNAEGEI